MSEVISQRERNKQRSRQAILDAAERLIGQQGFEATTAREIATEAGVSYQTLYNYFPTKAKIVEAIITADMEQTRDAGNRLVASYSGDLKKTLAELLKIQVDVIAHRDRHLWRHVVLDLLRDDPAGKRLFEQIDAEAHDGLERLLLRAAEGGELIRSVDIELLAHTLYSVVDYGLLGYLLRPTQSKVQLLQGLRAQIELIVTPYLADAGRYEV